MADNFPALPGVYRLIFLHLEPLLTFLPFLFVWIKPGAVWFYEQQIPSDTFKAAAADDRTKLLVWQLVNCYLLLGLLSSIVFRVIRDTLHADPIAQERLLGASLFALAIADVTHVSASFFGLPPSVRHDPLSWNGTTHGNITFTTFLFLARVSWFLGLGRKRYYFGLKHHHHSTHHNKTN